VISSQSVRARIQTAALGWPAVVEIGVATLGRSNRPSWANGTKVEHWLFSFISSNWRGEPLRDYETVVRLIAATTTARLKGDLPSGSPQVPRGAQDHG
jgi:Rhodopirellula transposase DDE domain